MDRGRQSDLEELEELKKGANYVRRERLNDLENKIRGESEQVRQAREEMIQAIRNGDRDHVNYVGERIRRIRKDETGGRGI
jgi:vacuolar-type H+-ATPase subunit H